ncbi:phosphotransferase [Spirosoma sp. RP8]|uniref:Phosphotransferase n=1 Tax=Spirosoma liriopis TaxID=2937440 RepID=A0ABT0HIB9_9BACT|nr:phosphotransferase [Spirosoma liriopis]MCK8491906.1 phosphotransferase [Spirosoma liriopis]
MLHLDVQEVSVLQDYLRRRGWLDTEERIASVEQLGRGRMNYTLRVTTANRTLIVKQSQTYAEPFSTISAPAQRAIVEGRFYERTQLVPMLANHMPQLLGVDEENNTIVLQDLGDARNYTFLYQSSQFLPDVEAEALAFFLSELHHQFLSHTREPIFANSQMRALNHESIFVTPFLEDNGANLDAVQPGLQQVATTYRQDAALRKAVRQLGALYLSDDERSSSKTSKPTTLLHGDYHPGRWLQVVAGETTAVKIIDPEFCFYGPPEFDLGVLVAHLMMAKQPFAVLDVILSNYEKPTGFDEMLRKQFTGIELVRRLIGPAQLPLNLSLSQKQVLLEEARLMLQ